MNRASTLFFGLGSASGDDRLGWVVADLLEAWQNGEAAGLEHARRPVPGPQLSVRRALSPIDLLNELDHVEHLQICDASHGAGRPGTIRRWEWPSAEIPGLEWSGTHDLALPAVLMLAERLGRIPNHVILWCVEGECREFGAPLSAAVLASLPALLEQLCDELSRHAAAAGH